MNSRQPLDERVETRNTPPPVGQDHTELVRLPSEEGELSLFARVRETGDRLTGGGIRALSKRLFLKFARRIMAMVMRRPRLMALVHMVLKRFPRLKLPLNPLAEIADPYAGRAYIPSSRLSNYVDSITMTLPASARVIYLRLRAAASNTGSWNRLE
jgi:hypothetical protein